MYSLLQPGFPCSLLATRKLTNKSIIKKRMAATKVSASMQSSYSCFHFVLVFVFWGFFFRFNHCFVFLCFLLLLLFVFFYAVHWSSDWWLPIQPLFSLHVLKFQITLEDKNIQIFECIQICFCLIMTNFIIHISD